MLNNMQDLKRLGFDAEFLQAIDTEDLENFEPARVIAVHKDSYVITNGRCENYSEIVGKLQFNLSSSLDLPTVGDWVMARFPDTEGVAVIHKVFPRKSLLKRKAAGKKVEYQLIGSNIDYALLMQALDSDFNLRRLERYVAMTKEGHIEPVVLLSKSDLCSPDEIEARIASIREIMPFLRVEYFSSKHDISASRIFHLLEAGKTYCLLGSSGVGKTSLLNLLLGKEAFATQSIRKKDNRGKHTTTSRQLVCLESGALIIDTPGMRELANISLSEGLDETFLEIYEAARKCLFTDCTHTLEKGCAVLSAVENGELSKKRYQNFIKMKKESDFHHMSYFEKRQKDMRFGKMVKSTMKLKNKQKR